MTDQALIDMFEDGALPADQFSHAMHVRVAWCYLRRYGLGGAIERFSSALRRYTVAQGAADKYHQTITVASLLVIDERLDGRVDESWESFAAAHPELLASRPSILARYYRDATLQSARARRVFVMPDAP